MKTEEEVTEIRIDIDKGRKLKQMFNDNFGIDNLRYLMFIVSDAGQAGDCIQMEDENLDRMLTKTIMADILDQFSDFATLPYTDPTAPKESYKEDFIELKDVLKRRFDYVYKDIKSASQDVHSMVTTK